MKIQWLGHACFRIEAADGYAVVLDPYADGTVPGLRPLRAMADGVLCSHTHKDHCATETVSLRQTGQKSPFTFTAVHTWHDDAGREKRGANTVHVLEADGVRAVHLGDLGHVLTREQVAAIGKADALMLPVGGYYTVGPAQAREVAAQLDAKVVLPMHYRTAQFGFDVIGTLDDYLALCGDVIRYEDNTLEIIKGMMRQTAVLSYL